VAHLTHGAGEPGRIGIGAAVAGNPRPATATDDPKESRMPDDDRRDGVPGAMHDFLAQLRVVTDRLVGLTGLAQTLPMSALPSPPSLPKLPSPPGALSAAQLQAIAASLAGQRRSIEATQAQLRAFDEQLAVLEQILDPLVSWSTTWADLERGLTSLQRRRSED
jgi:hypothetical protein